jgi:Domain of unknown function (DUF4258)
MKKSVSLTAHARIRLRDRRIDPRWIDETILDPDWTEVDPRDPAVERRFRAVPQFGGRAFFAWYVSRQIRAFAL